MEAYMTPMISPKSPRAEPKISTTKILMKVEGSCASARTHEDPDIPTHTPQIMLESPTPIPVQRSASEE